MQKLNLKYKTVFRTLFVFFIFYYSVIFQYLPFCLFHANVNSFSGNMKMASLLTAFSDLILLLIFLFIYRKELKNEFSIFISDWKRNIDTAFSCWIVGMIIMIISNSILIYVFHAEGANNEKIVQDMVDSAPIIMCFNVCLLAPIIEEIVFRKSLKDLFKNPIVFIMISFLTFGLAHVMSMATSILDWFYIIPYGALGGAFALAYYKTNSVWATIFLHMFHNILVFFIILFL